jgi:hypothetical protein
MISLLTAFFLYSADAAWPWWVAFAVLFVLETLGQIMIGLRK